MYNRCMVYDGNAKKVFYLVFITLLLFCCNGFGQIAEGLVGWWNFDDGTAADSSGNNRDGTLVGNAVIIDDPQAGKVLQLDGSGDYVQITGYKGITGGASRTVCAWIKSSSTVTNTVISWGTNANGQKWDLYTTVGKLRQAVGTGHVTGLNVANDGQWHHVASVLANDGTPNATEIKLYVDGVLETISSSTSYSINTGTTADVKIGTFNNGQYFNGLIDDVRVYNRALSQKELWDMLGKNPAFDYLFAMIDNWLTASPASDLNQDGFVNLLDFALIARLWGYTDQFPMNDLSKTYRIMPVGDSITAGGDDFYVYRYPLLQKLTALGYSIEYVGTQIADSPVGPLRHEGYGGKNTEYLATIIGDNFQQYPADIVLIHSGHNHFDYENPVPGIVAATETIIHEVRQTNPHVIVLLAKVITSGKLPKYSYIPELNEALGLLAVKLNTTLQPVLIVNQAQGFDWTTDTVSDMVHPNALGAEKMANRWLQVLTGVTKTP